LIEERLTISNRTRLPSGRGIAVLFQGTYIINVYAHSGAEKRGEREDFFTIEVPKLLSKTPTDIVLAGDFNCILENNDSTENKISAGR
jgi:exonuclease III